MGTIKDIMDLIRELREIRAAKLEKERDKERGAAMLGLLNALEEFCKEKKTERPKCLNILNRFAALSYRHSLRSQLKDAKGVLGEAYRELESETELEGIEIKDAAEESLKRGERNGLSS